MRGPFDGEAPNAWYTWVHRAPMSNVFFEITVVVVLATVFGGLARLFRQPTTMGYLVVGALLGPLGLMNAHNAEVLEAMSHIGLTLLLFLIGMEMRFKDLHAVGRPALLAGIGQVLFTAFFGFLLTWGFGYDTITAGYIGVALAFSSTIVAVKLLAEKRTVDSLYGRIVIGILLVQDFIAIAMLVLLTGNGRIGDGFFAAAGLSLLKAAALCGGAVLLGRYVLPRLLALLGRSQELLLLGSLAWGLGFASFASMPAIGLSIEVGGFLAGLALAESVQHYQITSRIKSLRDFFVVLFFVVLGTKLVLASGEGVWAQAGWLSALVLVGNPLIIMILLGALGYRSRTSFMAGLSVAQVSEFSLILMALAHSEGQVSEHAVALVTAVGIITIMVSSYLIHFDEQLFRLLRPVLKAFELGGHEPAPRIRRLKNHIVLIGCHRLGHNVLHPLEKLHKEFVVVDFNPDVVTLLQKRGIQAVYGDISDPEIQEAAGLDRARLVISTAPSSEENRGLLRHLAAENPKAKVILTGATEHDAELFYAEGADYVMLPHFMGGLHLAAAIKKDKSLRNLASMRKHDLEIIAAHPDLR